MTTVLRAFDVALGEVDVRLPSPVGGVLPTLFGFSNLTATTDPTATSDATAGYSAGSVWFNTTAGFKRVWVCVSAVAGAAKWAFVGADYVSGGTVPASEATQFGLGSASMAAEGNVNRQISSAGVSPGATGVDNVLAFFSIPPNSFDAAGRGLSFTAQGSFGATANNKDVKLIFNPATAVVGSTVGAGGVTIADTAVVATNNLGWSLQANVFKYGAANSNTQIGLHQQAQIGAAVAAMLKPSLIAAVENAAILIAVTGNAATAASDIVFNFLEVNAMN